MLEAYDPKKTVTAEIQPICPETKEYHYQDAPFRESGLEFVCRPSLRFNLFI
jgi:hypothetical protein